MRPGRPRWSEEIINPKVTLVLSSLEKLESPHRAGAQLELKWCQLAEPRRDPRDFVFCRVLLCKARP